MPTIIQVLARVPVPDIDAAIPLYQELAQTTTIRRFGFRDVQLAIIGPFLLLAGNTAAYQNRVATILVNDLQSVVAAITSAGGQITERSPGPNGDRLIARHPDGAVFEYIQPAQD